MICLKAGFQQDCESYDKCTLSNPWPPVAAELMTESGLDVTQEQVHDTSSASEWNDARSLSCPKIRVLSKQLSFVSPESNPSIPVSCSPVPICHKDDALAPEDTDRARLEKRASKRRKREEAPSIHAGELRNAQLKAEKKRIWKLVRSEDYERIHSFVNWRFRMYRASYPNNHEHSEDHIRTELNNSLIRQTRVRVVVR